MTQIKKIIKVKSLGVHPVYDIEMKGPNHNFVLGNGVVAHNCSHATGYATVAYTCLWLKHHYPLEWWCAVMSNATKDEISEKFWPYCSNLVLMPDISLSKGNFAIEGDKIRAPISLLSGMGESAQKQLAESAPYKDLRSFCSAIVNYQIKNSTIKEKVEKDGSIIKVKTWGRNALNIGKIHAMLQAGCMDSLFDSNLTISEKLDIYHNTMKELYLEQGKKYAKPKKQFPTLDGLSRYQAKKSVLPPYGEDLRPIVRDVELPPYLEIDGENMRIRHKIYSKEASKEVETYDPVIDGKQFIALETDLDYINKYYRFGLVCYVEKKEKFNWGENKSKEAYKFLLEFGGVKKELVAWPNFDGDISTIIRDVMEGSIIAIVIDKRKGKPDFSIRSMEVIRKPLEEKKELDTEGKEE